MDEIKFYEAYTRLNGYKNNIPSDMASLSEDYIREYHSILDLLEKTAGENLSGFRVHEIRSIDVHGKTKRFCDKPLLMMRLDAVISFFLILTKGADESGKKPIGFQPPN